MRSLGIILIISGLTIVGWFGFQYWDSMQSVEKIQGDDIIKEKPDDYSNPFLSEDETQVDTSLDLDFQAGDRTATLVIPSIDLIFDVFMGTDDDVLAKGVGMYQSDITTTPDIGGAYCVIRSS